MICNHDLQLGNRNSIYNQTNQANTANQSNATARCYKTAILHEQKMSDLDEESAEVEEK